MAMKRAGKIEQHNLGPRILDLLKEGATSADIAATFKAENMPISQPTISRWIKQQREETKGTIGKILQEHVEKTVPADLEALEEMERLCLAWAREEVDQKAERISAWKKVWEAISRWIREISESKPEEREDKCKAFAKAALRWVMEDIGLQRDRLSAMRQASQIIDLKLRYAGVLEGDGKGNIILRPEAEPPRDSCLPPGEEKKSDGAGRLLVFKGEDA